MTVVNRKHVVSILAVIAFVVMFVFSNTITSHAEEGNEAKIGTTEYETIDAAVEAAKDGDTITILKDAYADNTLKIDKKITLDLDMYTLQLNHETTEVLNNETGICALCRGADKGPAEGRDSQGDAYFREGQCYHVAPERTGGFSG